MSAGLRNWLIAALCISVLLAVLIPAILRARTKAWRTESQNNLRQLGIAFDNYADMQLTFPLGATVNESGDLLHGWQTLLMPVIEAGPYYHQIDFDHPWNDPGNAPIFRETNTVFLNPAITEKRDQQGFGLTHYAANSQFLGIGKSLPRLRASRQNLLGGEIVTNLPPWGRPGNIRNPSLGLDAGRSSYGSPWNAGVFMLLGDGSVRSFARVSTATY